MKYLIETHCHSCYSIDCNTPIHAIVNSCKKKNIYYIVITDHDCCRLSMSDYESFINAGVGVLKGIEFTTSERVHIIGIHSQIEILEQPLGTYCVRETIDLLHSLGAWIIIPHPCHKTGLIGNGGVKEEDLDFAFSNAHFIEKDNYKYGEAKQIMQLLDKYSNLRCLIGSDAHTRIDVGAFLNVIEADSILGDPMEMLYKHPCVYLKNKKHSSYYWRFKDFKKSGLYQSLLLLISPKVRRAIKNLLINR